MPKLHAFDAVLFHPPGDVSAKIAPPYDVLDEGPKQALLARDAHNVVAIDLPVTPPKTLGPPQAYERAGETFRAWLQQGVMKRTGKPVLIAYEQVYDVAGETLRRRGLMATLGVEDFNRKGGGIHRHELTIQGGLDDRYRLMEATRAQLSPIFGIFSDPRNQVTQRLNAHFDGREPDFFGTTSTDGVTHRCWIIDDGDTINQLAHFFDTTDVFIADGHHRYTTALKFGRDHPQLPGAQRCLFVLVAAEDPGMIVLPTHRVVRGMTGFSIDKLLKKLAAGGVAVRQADEPPRGEHAFGLFDGDTRRQFVVQFATDDPLAQSHADKPAVWRKLDVAICQHAVIDRFLKPDFGGEAVRLSYSADVAETKKLAADKPGQLAVLLQPTPLASVMGVSLADEVMPAKSTYFYPKLATGLAINPLD